jgi:DNA-binding HxlR family transcriptional regulator
LTDQELLDLLDSIGGEVRHEELARKLRGGALGEIADRLYDLADQGLVEMRTYWVVTPAGRASAEAAA